MNCKEATESYETWLGEQRRLLRLTCCSNINRCPPMSSRSCEQLFIVGLNCGKRRAPDLTNAPVVLAVGDLHVENFGTWRDQEGRLVWGVNDFDEAFDLPYTNDLVRLALSAHLAISANHLALRPADACEAILKGYAKGLKEGGSPFVLAERHQWLRTTVTERASRSG